jgi:hypothetical protein
MDQQVAIRKHVQICQAGSLILYPEAPVFVMQQDDRFTASRHVCLLKPH